MFLNQITTNTIIGIAKTAKIIPLDVWDRWKTYAAERRIIDALNLSWDKREQAVRALSNRLGL